MRPALASPPPAAGARPDRARAPAPDRGRAAWCGPTAFATWDEAELLEIPLIARQGTADAERLGVLPKPMRAVLGVG